jgi:uncharacterized coiled-coil protein SlyX
MSDKQKLIDLESRIAYLEQTIEDLGKIVFEQSKRIDEIDLVHNHHAARLNSLEESDPVPDERPPHY